MRSPVAPQLSGQLQHESSNFLNLGHISLNLRMIIPRLENSLFGQASKDLWSVHVRFVGVKVNF